LRLLTATPPHKRLRKHMGSFSPVSTICSNIAESDRVSAMLEQVKIKLQLALPVIIEMIRNNTRPASNIVSMPKAG
jgi:hypothetical protein